MYIWNNRKRYSITCGRIAIGKGMINVKKTWQDLGYSIKEVPTKETRIEISGILYLEGNGYFNKMVIGFLGKENVIISPENERIFF